MSLDQIFTNPMMFKLKTVMVYETILFDELILENLSAYFKTLHLNTKCIVSQTFENSHTCVCHLQSLIRKNGINLFEFNLK